MSTPPNQRLFIDIIDSEYLKIKEKNQAYSIRAFSKKIGLSPSTYSQFRRGKRKLSPKSTEKVLLALGASEDDSKKTALALHREALRKKKSFLKQRTLDEWTFSIISKWYYFAILSLLECKDVDARPASVADKLNISTGEATEALDRLFQLGLVGKYRNGEYFVTGEEFYSSDNIPAVALKNRHRDHLNLARTALEEQSVEERDFYSMTMAIDPNNIPKAKKLIREFQQKICRLLERGQQKEVYVFSSQLFALTQQRKKVDK
jgi:uncharacterized protein (TIGR02147 family)